MEIFVISALGKSWKIWKTFLIKQKVLTDIVAMTPCRPLRRKAMGFQKSLFLRESASQITWNLQPVQYPNSKQKPFADKSLTLSSVWSVRTFCLIRKVFQIFRHFPNLERLSKLGKRTFQNRKVKLCPSISSDIQKFALSTQYKIINTNVVKQNPNFQEI